MKKMKMKKTTQDVYVERLAKEQNFTEEKTLKLNPVARNVQVHFMLKQFSFCARRFFFGIR